MAYISSSALLNSDFSLLLKEEHPFALLWETLWPRERRGSSFRKHSTDLEDLEPSSLSGFLKSWQGPPDVSCLGETDPQSIVDEPEEDVLLADVSMEDESPDMDVDDDEPKSTLRYIAFQEHKMLQIQDLGLLSTLLIRKEYDRLIAHLNARKQPGERFFVTGQPGIGKSMGCYYILFLLLASARDVFFITEQYVVYYFSADGVQFAKSDVEMGSFSVQDAVQRSWVLVDVGGGVSDSWQPRDWMKPCFKMVWTSSPRAKRQQRFMKRFEAKAWYMEPWTSTEIAALTDLDGHDPKEIRERLEAAGPVARTLFKEKTKPNSIDGVINTALKSGVFNFVNMKVTLPEQVSHRMFLLRPRSKSDRETPSYDFLSNLVVRKTTALMAKHFEAVRAPLTEAFNFPQTRSLAGKLVECALHRALMGRTLPYDVENSEDGEKSNDGENYDGENYDGRNYDGGNYDGGNSDDENSDNCDASDIPQNLDDDEDDDRTIDLPSDLGGGKVAASLELIGKAQDFVLEASEPGKRAERPLYLRPQASNFAAINSIVISNSAIALVQSSVAESHSRAIRTLLEILARLSRLGFRAEVAELDLVYCVLGTDHTRVRKLMRQASNKLILLKSLSNNNLAKKLRVTTKVGRERLMKLQVRGYVLDMRAGLQSVTSR